MKELGAEEYERLIGEPANVIQTKNSRLRLLGFGVSGLQKAGSGQHQLFPEPDQEKQKRLDKAFDKIRDKFGHDALRRGK